MATPSLADDLALAHGVVDSAAPIGLAYFARGVAAVSKRDGSPVTEADRVVERVIVDALAAERPEDSVVGEETGARGQSARRWIIDPIDGTSHFVAGRPTWSTMLALEVDGEVLLGVVDCPALGTRLWAARDTGAFRASADAGVQRIVLPSVEDPSQARFTANVNAVERRVPALVHLEQLCSWTDRTERLAFDLLAGEVDIVLLDDHGDAWDHAPFVVLVEEAGGAFFDMSGGRRLDTRSCVYTAGGLESPVRAALGL